jgi:hypothetical protein
MVQMLALQQFECQFRFELLPVQIMQLARVGEWYCLESQKIQRPKDE